MNIELRNIKHHKSLSEETNACSADLYVDGIKVGVVRNSGRGEGMYPEMVEPEMLKRMYAWAKSLPAVDFQGMKLEMNLDLYLSELVGKDLAMKEAKRLFASFVCIKTPKGQLMRSKKIPKVLLEKIHSGQAKFPLREGETMCASVEEVFALISE